MASRLLLLLALLAGCSRTTLSHTVVEGTRDDEMAFWEALAKQRAVSFHDALYALLKTFDLHPGISDYPARIAVARTRGWIGETEDPPERETARAGWIAKVVCIETGIKGGVTMRLFGKSERYAVRELNYRRWLADMTPQQAMSGLQLIALLGEAEDRLAGGPETNPEDLPE